VLLWPHDSAKERVGGSDKPSLLFVEPPDLRSPVRGFRVAADDPVALMRCQAQEVARRIWPSELSSTVCSGLACRRATPWSKAVVHSPAASTTAGTSLSQPIGMMCTP